MPDNFKCFCGNNLILNDDRVCCNVCSTVYTRKGTMILNRHNWNIKEYCSSFQKEPLNLRVKRQS